MGLRDAQNQGGNNMNEDVNVNVNENDGQNDDSVKTYTQEEVLALIQSESDKRVNQALKTQQKKYEKQLSLSKLDGDERAKAEKDNRIAELEEKIAQMTIESNKSELKSVLSVIHPFLFPLFLFGIYHIPFYNFALCLSLTHSTYHLHISKNQIIHLSLCYFHKIFSFIFRNSSDIQ